MSAERRHRPAHTAGPGHAPARGSGDQAGRISKDGTHAPLEQSGQGTAGGTTSGQAAQGQGAQGQASGQQQAQGGSGSGQAGGNGGVTKNGQTMPLQQNPAVAMSDQDVNAQQQGKGTAAQQSGQGCE